MLVLCVLRLIPQLISARYVRLYEPRFFSPCLVDSYDVSSGRTHGFLFLNRFPEFLIS